MTSVISQGRAAVLATQLRLPATRGPQDLGGGVALSRQRLPTDPIGTATVTFAGIKANSEIRVYLPDGTEVAGVENCGADQVLLWPAYSVGNTNNLVRIVVMHHDYRLKEFTYTSTVGAQNLPIQQDRDPWYRNP